ncbi:hypothetical protein FA15DRAFT_757541 [Coprinopsis marcescibilis]|uniref:Transmembrane protein n=1 Tax=Coprinopsis marcescibilis TaxID=230819 RepID=A0A5C3KR38_COPMA|nr:hypothetical protein FA15DRAFT_757541 [Coprinopsis marcescibilis]
MPSYMTVFEDSAPFFTYKGSWRAGHSFDDRNTSRFSEGGYTMTTSVDATFEFEFYGTFVSINGGKRPNHGAYQVTVDDQAFPVQNAFLPAAERQFQATLFATNLTKGFHKVQLRNAAESVRDIDFVSWVGSVGEENEPLIVNTIQDTHPAFVYEPPESWTAQPPQYAAFAGASGHGSNSLGATASLSFTGDAIAVFGPSGPSCAPLYTVQIDNRPVQIFSAQKEQFRSRQLMYYGANLGPGAHTIRLALNATSETTQFLSIDYAEVYSTPSLGANYSFSAALPPVAANVTAPLGMIVGLALTSILAVLCLGALLYNLYLQKRHMPKRGYNSQSSPGDQEMRAYSSSTSVNPTVHVVEDRATSVLQRPQGAETNLNYVEMSESLPLPAPTYPVFNKSSPSPLQNYERDDPPAYPFIGYRSPHS